MTISIHSIQTALHDAMRCHHAGQLAAAISGYKAVLHQDDRLASAWHFLGVAYLQLEDSSNAIDSIRRAILLDDFNETYHNNLGVALMANGRLEEARCGFTRAITLQPYYADAIANLGLVHVKLGLLEKAIPLFRSALQHQPGHVDARFNLANLLFEQGKTAEAIQLYRDALKVQGNRGDILNNLGIALLEKKQLAEATACFDRAHTIDPRSGEAAFNAGKALAQQEKIPEARQAFEKAFQLRPHKPIWRLQRLGLCPTVFQSVEELDEYRAVLERDLDEALQTPLHVDIDELAWDGFVPSFNLAHHGRSNLQLLEKFAALFAPHIPKRTPAVGKGKTRVGFLLTDAHVKNFLRIQGGIVENLDPKKLDVVLLCPERALAELRAGIGRREVQWGPFSRHFNDAVATIAKAACDVLYFHKVSTDPLGYLLPFARLAPIQCTSWTTHFTSGVPEVDYYLSSSFVETENADDEYSEDLIRYKSLPSFERKPDPVPAASRADFGLPDQGSLYLCPQRLAKFHPAQDELFRQVLDQDPTGKLILLAGNNATALRYLRQRWCRTLGSAAARTVVLPSQSSVKLRQLMSVCDALLDIRHYSVSLMAFDAFAADLPIVSLPGKFKVERYALGFYRKAGLADLLATSPEQYVRLATRLGTDADFKHHVKNRIRAGKNVLFEDFEAVHEFQDFVENAINRHQN